MALTFTLDPDYGCVLMTVTAIAFEALMLGFIVVGGARKKVFSSGMLEKEFGEEHKKATGTTISKEGYPDMGCGRYSQKLGYADWLYFNSAQRVHHNFLEQLTPIILFILIGGLKYPMLASQFGLVYFVGRLLYCFYLSGKGAKHPLRILGALCGDIGLIGSFAIAMCAGWHIAKP